MKTILITKIRTYIEDTFSGLNIKQAWGETSFFYNPDHSRKNGAYFLTLKEKDGENDRASKLNRPEVYRINFCIPQDHFLKLFKTKPIRPSKGHHIEGDYDFTRLSTLTPHPVYGWMNWVSILNPTETDFNTIKPYIALSYDIAKQKFWLKK